MPPSVPLNGIGYNNYLGWTFFFACVPPFHSTNNSSDKTSLKPPTCTHPLPLKKKIKKKKKSNLTLPSQMHTQFPYKAKFSFRRPEDSDFFPSQTPAFQAYWITFLKEWSTKYLKLCFQKGCSTQECVIHWLAMKLRLIKLLLKVRWETSEYGNSFKILSLS